MIPITIPALSALKPGIEGKKARSTGVTTLTAKYPNTIVGIPERISSRGFTIIRTTRGAHSARKSAMIVPAGIATASETVVVITVPHTRGQIP
jgi:hypothetical protein